MKYLRSATIVDHRKIRCIPFVDRQISSPHVVSSSAVSLHSEHLPTKEELL
jgi:hypothetical protein